MSPDERQALRALRDCTVIRARRHQSGFAQLVLRGFAMRASHSHGRPIPGQGHQPRADFRLTVAGQHAARHQLDGEPQRWRGA